jgi:hypothetical protein
MIPLTYWRVDSRYGRGYGYSNGSSSSSCRDENDS